MIYFVIAAGLIFILMIVAFKLIKDSVKVVIGFVSLIILLLVTSSVLLYFDARELRENMSSSSSRVLVSNQGEILSGFDIVLKNVSNVTPLNKKAIIDISKNYNDKNYNIIKGDHYKLIVLSFEALNNSLDENIELMDGKTIKKETLFELLVSKNATKYYIENILTKIFIPDTTDVEDREEKIESIRSNLEKNIKYDDDYKFKAMISSLVFTKLAVDNTDLLIKEFKRKNVVIYPESIMLKIIKLIPDDSIKNKIGLIKEKLEDKIYSDAKKKVQEVIA